MLMAGAPEPAGTPDSFCADLARIVAAAGERPPFASLIAAGRGNVRLGEADWCVALGGGLPRFYCTMDAHFGELFETGPLAARIGQCLAGRLRPVAADREREQRFLIAHSGGVEIAAAALGCPYCEAGQTLALFVYAPHR
jgi:hypothetical protein